MTLHEFNLLNEFERKATVFTDGRFIDLQKNENEYVLYYAIESFFVELVYDSEMREVVDVRSSSLIELAS